MRKIVVFMTDKHSGHVVGLLNPETVVGDGRQVSLGETQRYLWSKYLEDIADIVLLARGDPIIILDGGDITQGNKHQDSLLGTCKADQITMAEWCLEPWIKLDNLTKYILNSGTPAHNFGEDSAESLLIAQLMARGVDARLTHHGLASVDGLKIDFSHHGTATGSKGYLKGNALKSYIHNLLTRELLRGKTPPRIVLRGHRHEYVTARATVLVENDNPTEYIIDGYICPSYCGLGDHARMVTQSEYILHNGMLAIEVIDGRLIEVHKMLHALDFREEILL